jgi:hypothetical protein
MNGITMLKSSTSVFTNHLLLRKAVVAGILLVMALIGYGMFRYPLILQEGGFLSITVPVFMLLLYGIVAVWFTQPSSQYHSIALRYGTIFGLVIGLLFLINIFAENFINMSNQSMTTSTFGFMFIMFVIFAFAGWSGAKNSGQVREGIFTSVWGAMIGALMALLFGFVINFLFTHRLEQNLQASAEYFRSGISDLETFTFYNTLDSTSSHLMEVPIIAALFGTIGSLIGIGLTRFREKNNKG